MPHDHKTRLNNMVSQRPGASSAGAAPGKGSRTENLDDKQPVETKPKSVFDAPLQKDLDGARSDELVLDSLDAAMATDFQTLLQELPAARKAANEQRSDKHVATLGYMLQALRAKDPTYEIRIAGDEHGGAWDNFTITVACTKSKSISGSAASGGRVKLAFADICDLDTYAGEPITATVKIGGRNAFDAVNITTPVASTPLTANGDPSASKSYTLSSTTVTK